MRGSTRIEFSLYACSSGNLSAGKVNEAVLGALELVSPEGEGLFVVQPLAVQWKNLAACRCLALADRLQGSIFVAWYAHMETGRVLGVCVCPTKANAEDDATWEKAVKWAAADFRFHSCPIFRVDFLESKKDGVELGPLRYYTKEANAGTVLAASKRLTGLHPNGPDLSTLLPHSPKVHWVKGGATRERLQTWREARGGSSSGTTSETNQIRKSKKNGGGALGSFFPRGCLIGIKPVIWLFLLFAKD